MRLLLSRRCKNWTARWVGSKCSNRFRSIQILTCISLTSLHLEPNHKDGDVSSLTIVQMEAIAFVHLGRPAVRPLGYGNKKQMQKEFAKHYSTSTWNCHNKRAGALAGGDAGDAKRHRTRPRRCSR